MTTTAACFAVSPPSLRTDVSLGRALGIRLGADGGEGGTPKDTALTAAQFASLYSKEVSYVWKSLQRLGAADRDLDDLTQEVFVIAFQRFDSYDASRPLRPWLFGIAFRVAAAQRNRAFMHREVSSEAVYEVVDHKQTPHDAAVTSQTLERVRKALGVLRVERKAVFVLHDVEGYSMPDVAQALSIPVNTAYTRLRAARAEFTQVYRSMSEE